MTNTKMIITNLGVKGIIYTVLVDEKAWCYTTNDDDAFKLQIAITKLKIMSERN